MMKSMASWIFVCFLLLVNRLATPIISSSSFGLNGSLILSSKKKSETLLNSLYSACDCLEHYSDKLSIKLYFYSCVELSKH